MDRQYRRVSTEEQQKEGTSLDWQLAKLAAVEKSLEIILQDIALRRQQGQE